MPKTPEPTTETLAETENYLVWQFEEPDGEITYHIELNNLTVHFFREEWQEFTESLASIEQIKPDEDGLYVLEVPNAFIFLDEGEWSEFKELIHSLE